MAKSALRIISLLGLVLSGCVPMATGTTYGSYAAAPVMQGTGVFVNGHELTAEEQAQLDGFLGGVLPRGRYDRPRDRRHGR
ncbi:MAG: hypothetical protein H0T79_04280 [Deltaproteobacteria bacterium]|nr:hypothetical protein [Deltaproteobacteria bacterium]